MNERVSTGISRLDVCLGGGLETGIITEIYGEAGSGKTNFCLFVAINSAKTGTVIYIDSEGVSSDRIAQITVDQSILSNIKFFRVRSYDEQLETVTKIANLSQAIPDIRMIIFDTITAHYRAERDKRAELRKRYGNTLTYQIEMLNNLAMNLNIPVIIVNQVYTEKDSSNVLPVGGSGLAHMAKAILKIEKTGSGRRDIVVMKHRSLPEQKRCSFSITEKGIE
ncbi:MAG: DNA repair and recombination protein RadB [Thermoplasmata archaeon]